MVKISSIASLLIAILFHEIKRNASKRNPGWVVGDPVKVTRLIKFSLDFNDTITKLEGANQCSGSTMSNKVLVDISDNIFRGVCRNIFKHTSCLIIIKLC